MLAGRCCRLLAFSKTRFSTASANSPLAVLRKKTGYSFSNCKKALEVNNHDIAKAEEWLHAQAKSEGWTKVMKLQSRPAAQGLIGLVCDNNIGAMVEVNCETDFVARNQRFQDLVTRITDISLKSYTSKISSSNDIIKTFITGADLGALRDSNKSEQSLADVVAENVGQLGENILIRRAVCIHVGPELCLEGYTHPPTSSVVSTISLGKFGGFVVYKKLLEPPLMFEEVSLKEVGKQLAQHIVGMNPTKIGSKDDTPSTDKDEESTLIHQEFLLDSDVKMGQLLEENGLEILDFSRFECGEVIPPSTLTQS